MWLSEEGRVSHARVNACEAGPKNMVQVMLHIVEKTTLGVYCNDNLGMTGITAALGPRGSGPEKRRAYRPSRILSGYLGEEFVEVVKICENLSFWFTYAHFSLKYPKYPYWQN